MGFSFVTRERKVVNRQQLLYFSSTLLVMLIIWFYSLTVVCKAKHKDTRSLFMKYHFLVQYVYIIYLYFYRMSVESPFIFDIILLLASISFPSKVYHSLFCIQSIWTIIAGSGCWGW